MIGKVLKGTDTHGLISYLVGPGRENEHTNPQVVAGHGWVAEGWRRQDGDYRWSYADRASLADHLDANLRVALQVERDSHLGAEPPSSARRSGTHGPHVMHFVLSLGPSEGKRTEAEWGQIAQRYVEEFGGSEWPWVAVHHGTGLQGNDHIHIALNRVRDDGAWLSMNKDYSRSAAACRVVEAEFGLKALKDRGMEKGLPGYSQKDGRNPRKTALGEEVREPRRVTLERTVRAAAAASVSEKEFVEHLKAQNLLVLPRFGKGGTSTVVGYSVSLRPHKRERLWWMSGGKLAPDLTLGQLRKTWSEGSPRDAVASWGGQPASTEVELSPLTEQLRTDWEKEARKRLWSTEREWKATSPTDGQWRRAASDMGGLLGLASAALEPAPARLARAARACAIAAQGESTPASPDPRARANIAASARLLMRAGDKHDLAGWSAVLEQMARLAAVMREAQFARGELVAAQRTQEQISANLRAVQAQLQAAIAGTPDGLSAEERERALTIRATAQVPRAGHHHQDRRPVGDPFLGAPRKDSTIRKTEPGRDQQ